MTQYLGRILGLMIGALFGPMGMIIGFLLGNAIDQNRSHSHYRKYNDTQHSSLEALFFEATFLMLGYIAKADGIVTQVEIQKAEKIMRSLGLNSAQRQKAMQLFYQGKRQSFDYANLLDHIASTNHSHYLNSFMTYLIEMAYATGRATQNQKSILQNVCHHIGLHSLNFIELDARYRNGSYRYRRPHSKPTTPNPYDVLGVNPNVSDAELRRAYRRLMSRYHPDKLISKGASPKEIKDATDKTQKIRTAYENILQQRGIAH